MSVAQDANIAQPQAIGEYALIKFAQPPKSATVWMMIAMDALMRTGAKWVNRAKQVQEVVYAQEKWSVTQQVQALDAQLLLVFLAERSAIKKMTIAMDRLMKTYSAHATQTL